MQKPSKNLLLKKEIAGSGQLSREIAEGQDWQPSKISKIISGSYIPTDKEKEQLAQAIGVPVEAIFSQPTVTV